MHSSMNCAIQRHAYRTDHCLHFLILPNLVRLSGELVLQDLVFLSLFRLELNINPSLNSRLLPAHIQGQQQGAAAAAGGGATSNATAATAASHSLSSPTSQEKPVNSNTRTNQSPPPSMVPEGNAVPTSNAHGTAEGETMNSLDDPTTASVDSMAKDRS